MAGPLQLSLTLRAETGAFGAAIRGAETQVSAAAGRMSGNLGAVAGESRRAADELRFMGQVAAAVATGAAAQKVLTYAEAWTTVQGKLKLVTSSTVELQQVTESLFAVAQRTGAKFEATGELYARMSRATRELSLSQGDLVRITETVNKAVAISGGSAASAEAGLFQFGQALAAGALRGEELNSVLEQTPRLAEAIASGMGASVGALRKLAEAGTLTSDAVVKALQKQAKAIDAEYAQLPPTIGRAWMALENGLTRYIGEADQAHGVSLTLASGIQALAGNLDTVATVAGTATAALAAIAAGRAGSAALSAIADLSTASNGLRSAGAAMVSMLGGPVGAALTMAAGAALYLATRQSVAEKAARDHAEALRELGSSAEAARLKVSQTGAVMDTTERVRAKLRLDQAEGNMADIRSSFRTRGQYAAASFGVIEILQVGDSAVKEVMRLERAFGDGSLSAEAFGKALSELADRQSDNRALRSHIAGLLDQVDAFRAAERDAEKFRAALAAGASATSAIGESTRVAAAAVAALGDKLAETGEKARLLRIAPGLERQAAEMAGPPPQAKAPVVTGFQDRSPVNDEYLGYQTRLAVVRSRVADARSAEGDDMVRKTRAAIEAERSYQTAVASTNVVEIARARARKEVTVAVAEGQLAENKAADVLKELTKLYETELVGAAGAAAKELDLQATASGRMAAAAGLGEAAQRAAAAANREAEAAAKGNVEVARVHAANLREEAAAVLTVRNETVRGLELEVANTNRMAAAVAAGAGAVRQAREEEYRQTLIRKLGTDATREGTDAQKALNDAMAAYRANQAANDNLAYQQQIKAANDNITLAGKELALGALSEAARERAVALLRKEQELRETFPGLADADLRKLLEKEATLLDMRAAIERQREAWKALTDSLERAFDRLGDALVQVFVSGKGEAIKWGDLVRGIIASILSDLIKMAVAAPLKNWVFGTNTPTLWDAVGKAAGGQGGIGAGDLLSLGSKFVPESWTSGLTTGISDWAALHLGLGGVSSSSVAGAAAASQLSAAGVQGATVFSAVPGMPGSAVIATPIGADAAATSAALTTANTSVAGSAAGTAGLLSYFGPAAAGFAAGGWLGPLLANGNKAVGGLAGAASGAAAGALIGSFVPGIGTAIGALIGGAGGGLGGLLGTQKPSVGPNSSVALATGAGNNFGVRSALADNGGSTDAVTQVGNRVAQAVNGVLTAVGATNTRDRVLPAIQYFEKGQKWYVDRGGGDRTQYADQTAVAAALVAETLRQVLEDGTTQWADDGNKVLAANIRRALDASIGKPTEELIADLQFSAQNFATLFDAVGKSGTDQFSQQLTALSVQFQSTRSKAAELGLTTTGMAASFQSAADRLFAAAGRAVDGLDAVDNLVGQVASWRQSATALMGAGLDPAPAMQLLAKQLAATVNALGDDIPALQKLTGAARILREMGEDTAATWAAVRADQVRTKLQQDLDLRKQAALVALGQADRAEYDRRVLAIQQAQELAGVTDTALRAQLAQVQALEAQASAARSAADATSTLAQAQAALKESGATLADWLDRQRGTAGAGVSTSAAFASAKESLTRDLRLGSANDNEALKRVPAAADRYLEAAKALYGTGQAYQSMRDDLLASVAALPAVRSWEDEVAASLASIAATATAQQAVTSTMAAAAAATADQTGATAAATLAANDMLAELRTQTAEQVRTSTAIAASADVTVRGIAMLGEIMAAGLQSVTAAVLGLPHAAGGLHSGRAMINDGGPEMVELPTGSRVVTHRASMAFVRQLRREGGAGAGDTGAVVAAIDRLTDAVFDAAAQQVGATNDVGLRLGGVERQMTVIARASQERGDLALAG